MNQKKNNTTNKKEKGKEKLYDSKFSGNVLGLIIKLYHQNHNFSFNSTVATFHMFSSHTHNYI